MGYLQDKGVTYDYFESIPFQNLVKEKGIIQFLNLLHKFGNFQLIDHEYDSLANEQQDKPLQQEEAKETKQYKLFWGDEFEGHVVKLFPEHKKALLQPNTQEVFRQYEEHQKDFNFILMPEFGSWMIEMTPNKPYQNMCFNVDQVLINMRTRVNQIRQFLQPNNQYLLIPVYPLLGVGQFTTTIESDLTSQHMEKVKSMTPYFDNTPTQNQPEVQLYQTIQSAPSTPLKPIPNQPIYNYFSKSKYFDDRIINPHPRYSTFAQNVRLHRGSPVDIQIPIFKDIKTSFEKSEYEPNPGFITMDHFGFGMGNCALQTTYLSIDIDHARFLYDQLAVLGPIFLTLTAGSPAYKGKLADWDNRWECLSQACDCRNEKQRDPQHASYIPKSRYSSISYYISNSPMNLQHYNDIKFPRNEQIMNFAREKAQEMGLNLDDKLLNHLGILFIRDNMVIYKDKVHVDDNESTGHFESIQSSNWNSVRFKPPPTQHSKIGWRVEFRTMEIQLTPEENAAWQKFDNDHYNKQFFLVNFYIPLSLVDENMKRSRERNAVVSQKFYFRTNIYDSGDAKIEELTINEIIQGKSEIGFGGIQGAIDRYREACVKVECCKAQEEVIIRSMTIENQVIDFVKQRASGELKTLAQWIRNFFVSHPNYKKDSVIDEEMNYDLISTLLKIRDGHLQDKDFPKIFSL